MKSDITSQDFFEDKYRRLGDPWNFAGSPYERYRYQTILAALGHRRYRRAFEPGSSIGVLTSGLAAICDRVHAMDISPEAVRQARIRCNHLQQVEITCGALPGFLPPGIFDLILLSEVGYYLPEETLSQLGNTLVQRLAPGGVLLATHWLGASADHLLSGDRVHEVLHGFHGLVCEYSERHENFRLDRWTRQ